MNQYIELIVKIIPIIALFLLGVLLRKIKFFKEGSIGDLKKLVVNITLPSLLFTAFASARFKASYLLIIGTMAAVCTFMLLIGKPAGRLMGIKSRYFALLMPGFEMGMLGYAVFTSVFGMEHIDKIAIMDLGQVLWVFFVLMTILIKMKGGAASGKEVLKLFVTSPVIIAIFAGVAVSLINTGVPILGNRIWGTIDSLAKLIGGVTTPAICIVIGYELKLSVTGLWKSAKTILVRTALLITIGLLLNRFLIRGLLGMDKIYEYALLTMFILPPAFIIPVFMDSSDRENASYVANTLSLSTVVSIGVFIILMIVLGPI